jgi:3-methyl-2-oxobutanoate hydroxymethyltransferase
MTMRISLTALQKMKIDGERIAMLTAYDASFGAVVDSAGVDTILIGDSLGMVVQGHDTTLPVTQRDAVYHTACVARGSKRSFIIADMPWGSYQTSPAQAFANAAELMAVGAQMVKLEGGECMAETIAFLTARGVPVCGHLGLTPQSVHALGGYRVQGKTESAAERLLTEARMIEEAGAGMVVLELIPAPLAKEVTAQLRIPTIGIGAGVFCSGQVLVLYDMIDVFPGKKAKFVKNFLRGAGSIEAAIAAYVKEVKAGTYPGPEHSF